jgi:hypothetical protein
MKKTLIILGLAVASLAQANLTAQANLSATVTTSGPNANTTLLNVETGVFGSFAVADFAFATTANFVTSQVVVNLTQQDTSFSAGATVDFFLTTNTTADITHGSSIKWMNGGSNDGIDSSLSGAGATLYSLGSGNYTKVSSGHLDTFTFSVNSALSSYIETQLASGADLRLVLGTSTTNGAATYAGYSNTVYAGPSATLVGAVQSVPEPVSMSLFAMATLGFLGRKRK